ncbi:TPA: hypothetical protein N0F65_005469 [Lagenidium giganteum]|uniref:Uncharacterized protein n=1 Tax=Lagenidium giganteum TaxID=4803 RepID=A0AAV2YY50_9STRA|nr:TPA: hypothetical protein N0F65_005469 [Lagenidium giganteum]
MSEPAFRQILQRLCPRIQIRSPRCHVCDTCTIYKNAMQRTNVLEEAAQLLGRHTDGSSNEVWKVSI